MPWVAVSHRLGMKPAINYAASVLYNYQLKDPAKPLHPGKPIDVDNLYTLLSFTGTESECWFFMIHAAAEVAAGPGLEAMVHTFQCMKAKDNVSICESLDTVKTSINKMKGEVQKISKNCTFYEKIRPFITGSVNQDVIPHGLVFNSEPQKYHGASAAQTSSIYAFDMLNMITNMTS